MSAQADVRVVGAGFGRTGTHSLKLALERLLDGPCYHMLELLGNREHDVPLWIEGARTGRLNAAELLNGYRAIVDFPGCFFWDDLAQQYPGSLIVLSTRESSEAWWRSASRTIFDGLSRGLPGPLVGEMWTVLAERSFTTDYLDREQAIAAYERHNADVRARAPRDRLVDWQPSAGWGPLCAALGVPVPDEPFPHTNTTEGFLARRKEP
ncbi:MAG: sulfotransferase family protein [Gaiellales bacterium]